MKCHRSVKASAMFLVTICLFRPYYRVEAQQALWLVTFIQQFLV